MARFLRLVLILCLAMPLTATAGSVYLNGVLIDGVTGVKFEKATVRIDESGNIFIDAPGYAAKVMQGGEQQATTSSGSSGTTTTTVRPPGGGGGEAPKKISKRYWLVSTQNAPGMTEYDIDVYINAKWLMTLRNHSDQEVVDITRHLVPGENMVTLEAKKVAAGPRKSFSSEHAFSVVVGEGNEAEGNVMIDRPVVTFRRSAADNDNVSKDFSFQTR